MWRKRREPLDWSYGEYIYIYMYVYACSVNAWTYGFVHMYIFMYAWTYLFASTHTQIQYYYMCMSSSLHLCLLIHVCSRLFTDYLHRRIVSFVVTVFSLMAAVYCMFLCQKYTHYVSTLDFASSETPYDDMFVKASPGMIKYST